MCCREQFLTHLSMMCCPELPQMSRKMLNLKNSYHSVPQRLIRVLPPLW